ncbi:hypothetical protein Q5691_00825 [Microcoleus sp. w1-18aA5]|uniref:hypothetical protein n=1 Tax=Microcoleus sp. w1-18aA5 TaxID=2818982 RepID=UPI002FD16016
MKRKTLNNQTLNPSNCLELSDREAEALQGGAIQPEGDRIVLHLSLTPVQALVLLFANPFA